MARGLKGGPSGESRKGWCRGAELNCRHPHFQCGALPTELPRRQACLPAGRFILGRAQERVKAIAFPGVVDWIWKQGGADMTSPSPSGEKYWPLKRYFETYERSLRDPEGFWEEEARRIPWFRTWDRVLEWDMPFARWFPGGELNASYLCVDQHVKTWRKSKVAIYWEGEPGDTRVLSYSTLYREVNRFAGVLKKLGGGKGDKEALYLPMIPELPIFMLACGRLG